MMSVFKSLLGREETSESPNKQTLCTARNKFQRTAILLSDHPSRTSAARKVLVERDFHCPDKAVGMLAKTSDMLKAEPEMILLFLSPNVEKALETLQQIRNRSAARILAVGPNGDPQLILKAMRTGADEYLDEKDVSSELVTVLSSKKSGYYKAIPQGKVLSVIGATGGVGVSTLTANLGCALSANSQKTMLFDLQMTNGTIASLLDVKFGFTLKDLTQQKLDRTVLERSLGEHESGAHLLASPRQFQFDAEATFATAQQAINLGKILFHQVILDLGSHFESPQLELLKQSDDIFLVFQLNFLNVKNVQDLLCHLHASGIDPEKVTLIVNRYGQVQELELDTAQDALEQKLPHLIPDEPKTVHRALNHGTPFVQTHSNTKVSRAIQKLAESLVSTTSSN